MNRKDNARFEEMRKNMLGGEFSAETPTTLDRETPTAGADLSGLRVAVIVADGFEQVEFDQPVEALKAAGATVCVLAEDAKHLKHIHGVNHFKPGPGTRADRLIDEANADQFDALLIPGGAISPDTMRQSPAHLALVKAFFEAGKPVFSICHGPWLLADAGQAEGRKLTSWPGIRRDLERAGADWVDQAVVVDGQLVTSRKPDDIPAFNAAILKQLAALKAAR